MPDPDPALERKKLETDERLRTRELDIKERER